MESQSPEPRPSRPTMAEARDALDGLDADGARLARRVVTPWWYHVGLAAIVFTLIGAQGLRGVASIMLVALAVVAIPVLTLVYSHRYGVSTAQPGGRRSRRLLVAAIAVLVLGMLSALVVRFTEATDVWVVVPAAVAAAAIVVLGRRYDDALRIEIARHDEAL